MTSSVIRQRSSSKALPKAKFAPKKSHGPFLVVCCQSDPLQQTPAKPLHLRSMLSRWMKCTKPATPAVSIGQQKGPNSSPTTTPDLMSHNQRFKSWRNWATKFFLIHHTHLVSCQLTITSLSISESRVDFTLLWEILTFTKESSFCRCLPPSTRKRKVALIHKKLLSVGNAPT